MRDIPVATEVHSGSAQWWDDRGALRQKGLGEVNKELNEGLIVYAIWQAEVQPRLSQRFVKIWRQSLNDPEYQEDGDDHSIRMQLGLKVGKDEDELLEEVQNEHVESKDEQGGAGGMGRDREDDRVGYEDSKDKAEELGLF
ncbi:hypothetical protein BDP27DRAFT_1360506 [Rhodocollybia butyracea]|uniref:Uncharacterized protein n=1 Tax=Rhodocollybia butyracea TaxID=206335 RepID=A0A9P5Q2P3_9AGAR|nr:hypothetical protein BDP27DRAFT_1360506 [Rhodocollybia butyracea]